MLLAIEYSRFFNYELVDLKARINLELKGHCHILTDISVLHLPVVVFLENFIQQLFEHAFDENWSLEKCSCLI